MGQAPSVAHHQVDALKQDDLKTPIQLGMPILVSFVTGSIVGNFLTGEDLLNIALAGNGAAGAVGGLVVGAYASDNQYAPLVGAVVLPSLLGGDFDGVVVGIAVGTYAGYTFAMNMAANDKMSLGQ